MASMSPSPGLMSMARHSSSFSSSPGSAHTVQKRRGTISIPLGLRTPSPHNPYKPVSLSGAGAGPADLRGVRAWACARVCPRGCWCCWSTSPAVGRASAAWRAPCASAHRRASRSRCPPVPLPPPPRPAPDAAPPPTAHGEIAASTPSD
jgi:hypothetical protein